jgi:hypothetical protein
MPGDPKQGRQYALRCADLAHSARTPELKSAPIELSKNWAKIAIELERSAALLDMEDPAPAVPRRKS